MSFKSSQGKWKDPAKRAAKRARQRAAGYRGVKKGRGGALHDHNSGKMHRDGRKGESKRQGK